MTFETIEELLEQKAINREHVHIRRHPDQRFSTCICGEFWWTGKRWDRMPDRSLYEDALGTDAARLGIER